MEQKQSTEDWSEREIEVSEVLIEMHRSCLLRRIPFTWGFKKRRSAIQEATASPSSSQSPSRFHGGADGGGGSSTVVKVQVSSPATPLSFSPTESDEKPKPSRRKASLKRKREYYLKIVEDLTKSKASLSQEIDNVKRHCVQLKAFNLKLKERKQELCYGPKSESENPNLEFEQALQLLHAQQQQQQQMQMPNPTTSFPVASSSSSGLGCNVDINKGPGPLPLPDLNLTIEELSDQKITTEKFIHVDSVKPLDEAAANNKDLSKVMAAQARQRRLQINRLKKPTHRKQ